MAIRIRALLVSAAAILSAMPALAQSWTAGAALGLTEDVSHRFALDELKSRDVSAWISYEAEPEVQLRGTFGSLRTTAANSERLVAPDLVAPRLTSHIDYATVGVSYEFVTGDYASGIFAGIGGYKVRPDAAPADFEAYRDRSETVFGWHLGVDGSLRIVSRLSGVGRITVHGFRSGGNRTILTTAAGLAYRF